MKICIIIAIVVFLNISSTVAASPEETITGGRLYDKWWVDTKLPQPSGTHPAYPKAGKKKGADTWRCKECHGWDYNGKDGAYEKGSHYTGIKGIRGMVGASTDTIVSILTNKNHQYGDKLPDSALKALAQFVSGGQMDMGKYINANKEIKGNASAGMGLFAENCRSCHGKHGDSMNLSHEKGKRESVGSIANENPWETLHKIRFGQPGAVMDRDRMHSSNMSMQDRHMMGMPMWEAMPPMFNKLSEMEQVDLLRFLQTLSGFRTGE